MNATMIGVLSPTPATELTRGGAGDHDPEAFALALDDAVTSAAAADEHPAADRTQSEVARDRSPAEDAVRAQDPTRSDDPIRTPTAAEGEDRGDEDTPAAGPATEIPAGQATDPTAPTTPGATAAVTAAVPTAPLPSSATGEETAPAQPAGEASGATTIPEAVGRGRTEAAAFRVRLTGVPSSSSDAMADPTAVASATAGSTGPAAGATIAADVATTASTTADVPTPTPAVIGTEVLAGTDPAPAAPTAAASSTSASTGSDPAAMAVVTNSGDSPAGPTAATAPGGDPDAVARGGTSGSAGDIPVGPVEGSADGQPDTAPDADTHGRTVSGEAPLTAAESDPSAGPGDAVPPGGTPGEEPDAAATPTDAAALRSSAAPAEVSARRPVAAAAPVTPPVAQHDQARPTATSQVATAVAALQRRGEGEYVATLDLHPSELGRVRVEVQVRAGVVNVALSAEQQGTRSLFSQQVADLRAALEQGGMSAGDLDVSQQAFGREDSRQQGSDSPRDGTGGPRGPFTSTAQITAPSADLDMTGVPLTGLDVRL